MSIGLFTSLNHGRYLLLLQLITVLCIVNFKLIMETASLIAKACIPVCMMGAVRLSTIWWES